MKYLIVFIVTFSTITIQAQGSQLNDTLTYKNRIKWIAVAGGALYSAALLGLNELWYKNSPRRSFHFFNDNREWLQVDKVGHFYSAFHLSRIGVDIVQWTATTESPLTTHLPAKALAQVGHSPTWLGCALGFLAMTPVEILDGFSAQHGASWGDLIANAAGSGLALGQYLLWDELRIYPKYSFHQTRFAPIRPNMLGKNLSEQSLKDYNGQTYWLSVNIASFLNIRNKDTKAQRNTKIILNNSVVSGVSTRHKIKFPPWLNVSFGYGAHGMLGGFENVWYQENKEIDYTNIPRYRRYYLSLDID